MTLGKGLAVRTVVPSVTDHGGSLDAARARFPSAPEPWIDLSTGINPHAYPQLDVPRSALTRLPEQQRIRQLCEIAAQNYGAPSADHVAAAPGTQILLPMIAGLVPPGKALVLGPTYAEHARAAALAGHECRTVFDVDALFEADLAVVVNPNNPDGRLVEGRRLVDLAKHLRGRGGLLVVDEAFMDVGPFDHSVAGHVKQCGAIILKSFGKFFGLAGLRLGFALGPQDIMGHLNDTLGPWAVAGPSVEYGMRGLADAAWQQAMRGRLAMEAEALDKVLSRNGLRVNGGTSLFRFVRSPQARHVFEALAEAGILVRRFDAMPDALRFGLPAGPTEKERLDAALAACKDRAAACRDAVE